MAWDLSTVLTPVPVLQIDHVTGRVYSSHLGGGTLTVGAVAANTLYAHPFNVPQAVTYTVVSIEVTTFATGNARLGVYANNAGVPGALILDAGAVSTGTANGEKTIAISLARNPGKVWLAAVFDAAPSVRLMTSASGLHWLGASSGTDTNIHMGVSVAFTYAALPDPFTAGSVLYIGNFPRIMLTV
jgi:hypothetical protein